MSRTLHTARLLGTAVTIALLLSFLAAPLCSEEKSPLRLAKRGRTSYRIVIAGDATDYARRGAEELALHLKEITSAWFPIVTDAEPIVEHEILIGPSSHLEQIGADVDVDSLSDEEYRIKTVGHRLVIVGGPRRGVLHGVWAFLEEDLGCRWYTPDFNVIPKNADLSVEPIDRRYNPPFECRSIWSHNGEVDPVWAARVRLNSFVRHMKDAEGRRIWKLFFNHPLIKGSWYYAEHSSHTFPRLVSLGAYYDDHPEYFSLVDGKRVKKEGQLCMTHPDVARISADWATSRLAAEPEAKLVSISAGDYGNFCRCDNCTAQRERYPETKVQGACGQAAVLLPFVNAIAQRVHEKHPGALVTTLAYQWTRIPAADLPVSRNVVVRYCPIEVCAVHPIDDPQCPWNMRNKNHQGTRFLDELTTWTKIAPHVWIWYYAHDREGSLQPGFFLGTASADFRLFQRLGVKGVQVQARVGRSVPWAPLQQLKSYIFAKLTWNPQYNVAAGVREFCRAYYGPAAAQMEAYAWALHDADTYDNSFTAYMKPFPGIHAGVGETRTPIKPKRLREFDAWFDRAEKSVDDDSELLGRVRVARMSLQYAILCHAVPDDPLRKKALDAFFPFALQIGVQQILELGSDKKTTLAEFAQFLSADARNQGAPD